jgi:hypothetical protein
MTPKIILPIIRNPSSMSINELIGVASTDRKKFPYRAIPADHHSWFVITIWLKTNIDRENGRRWSSKFGDGNGICFKNEEDFTLFTLTFC